MFQLENRITHPAPEIMLARSRMNVRHRHL